MYIFNMKLDQLLESRVRENFELVQPIATFSINNFGSSKGNEHLTIFLAISGSFQRQLFLKSLGSF